MSNPATPPHTVRLPVLQKTDLSPALALLAEVRPAPAGVGYEARAVDAKPIPACQPPEQVPPQFVIRLRRPFVLGSIPLVESAQASLACSQVFAPHDFECQLALDLRFKQVWKLMKTLIGDLSTTIGLAPGEEVRLDFQVSQRRVLDQSKLDSAEELTSLESTTLDKEALNVARASSRTQNWKVDGSGSLSLGSRLGIQVSVGYGETATDSAQSSVQHITEATEKSSQSLKTLQKIEVRSVTEAEVHNRVTRSLRNPFLDRTISINVFHLLKHFWVETLLEEVRPTLVIPVNNLKFNEGFIEGNSGFLRKYLIDPALAGELDKALEAAREYADKQVVLDKARKAALRALNYLYNFPIEGQGVDENSYGPPQHAPEGTYPNVFGINEITDCPGNPNNPLHSFFAYRGNEPAMSPWAGHSAFTHAINHATISHIFLVLSAFQRVSWQLSAIDQLSGEDGDKLPSQAIDLALAIENSVSGKWEALLIENTNKIKDLIDPHGGDFTEVFRRLPGFLAMVAETVRPLAEKAPWTAEDELNKGKREACLARLKAHLDCHRSYYIQSYLSYLAATGAGQSIFDFVYSVMGQTHVEEQLLRIANVEGTFVDRQNAVVPFRVSINDEQFMEFLNTLGLSLPQEGISPSQVKPGAVEIDVPADGVHLEVAEGLCVLSNLEKPASELPLDLCKLMGQFLTMLMQHKLPGVDVDKLIAAQQKNIEAVAEANLMSVEGIQALAKRQVEVLQESIKEASEAVSSLSKAGSPAELAAEQAELVKSAFEKSVAMMREMAEILIKSSREATDRISAHIAATAEEICSLGSSTK